jgi:hypothetical protein
MALVKKLGSIVTYFDGSAAVKWLASVPKVYTGKRLEDII